VPAVNGVPEDAVTPKLIATQFPLTNVALDLVSVGFVVTIEPAKLNTAMLV
jgi:hypothetical protein